MNEIDFTDQIKARLLEQEGFEEEITKKLGLQQRIVAKSLTNLFAHLADLKSFQYM